MLRYLNLLLLFAGFNFSVAAADLPVPPKDAAAKMTVPPGFHVTLCASEPQVVQPIAFTFDDRGRMWVVECMMYPKWSQDGKGGKDRVIILESTKNDGVFDKKTVFLDDGVNLSGIELGFGGVYLCSSPNFIFIPIKDDKPAGKPVVLLDGWNIKEAKHNIFNSLIWGPDGWLYGCNGIQTKSKIGAPGTPADKRIFFDCGVWRFHPTKKQFEVVANGTTNPFGLDFDAHGEMFITNCVIDHLFHFVPGGHYTRMYGTDPNPHVYGAMTSAVDYKHWGSGNWTDSRANQKTGALKKEHDDAGGGHAHSGAAIYLGENFPKEYRNTLFTCNIHGNRLNNDGLEHTADGMRGVRRNDFWFGNDPWFRGICVKQGPEGGLYVSDWSDTGECHNYQVVDNSNGRIYRTVYGEVKGWSKDVNSMTDVELAKAALGENEWLVRKARRILQERASRGDKIADSAKLQLSMAFQTGSTAVMQLRGAWGLHAIGALTSKDLANMLSSADDHVRVWGIRLAVETKLEYRELVKLLDIAIQEKSTLVRLHLFGALQKLDLAAATTVLHAIRQPILEKDTNLALMHWFAVERIMRESPKDDSNLITNSVSRLSRQYGVRKYLSADTLDDKRLSNVLSWIQDPQDNLFLIDILSGMKVALRDQRKLTEPKAWKQIDFSKTSVEVRALADEVSLIFGNPDTIAAMKLRITDTKADAVDRSRAVGLLANRKTADLEPILRELLQDAAVRGAAIRALANYPNETTPSLILSVYSKLTADEKADAVQTLVSRPSFAKELLQAVEKGTVAKSDITAFTARQIVTLKDKSLQEMLAKTWGEVKPASANRTAQMTKYKKLLAPEAIQKANIANGKMIFTKNCATCHKLHGEGQIVGPELTGSQRGNLDYILENVVDPSSAVANEYKMANFFMADGRIISGIVRSESANTVTVRTLNEEVQLAKANVESRKSTNISIMPDGLFDAMKEEEVRDLVGYLQSNPKR